MAEAVILAGLPGAGKSTYFETHLAATHARVSGDLHGSRALQERLVQAHIARGESFAVDNTNLDRASRQPFIELARAAGYRVVCFYLEVPLKTAIARNKTRPADKQVPVPAIAKFAKKLQPPVEEEGFDEIRVIRAEPS